MILVRHEHYVFLKEVVDLRDQLTRIELKLDAVSAKENRIMATAKDLMDAVASEHSVVDGVVAAIKALQDKVTSLPNVPADVQKAIDDAVTQLTSDRTALANAIAENTPVEVGDVTGTGDGTAAGDTTDVAGADNTPKP